MRGSYPATSLLPSSCQLALHHHKLAVSPLLLTTTTASRPLSFSPSHPMALPFTTTTFLTSTKTLAFSRPAIRLLSTTRAATHVVRARRRLPARNRGRKGVATEEERGVEDPSSSSEGGGSAASFGLEMSSTPMPVLPGEEKDFWEGPQWDTLGFLVEYLWAFGIVFALIACGIAVATYNEGATDFKQTPAYKEAIQSQELLEEPDAAGSDVFEGNPTEDAPSVN